MKIIGPKEYHILNININIYNIMFLIKIFAMLFWLDFKWYSNIMLYFLIKISPIFLELK